MTEYRNNSGKRHQQAEEPQSLQKIQFRISTVSSKNILI
jgi:hypothetical protein